MRYWAFSIIILLLPSTAWGQISLDDWQQPDDKKNRRVREDKANQFRIEVDDTTMALAMWDDLDRPAWMSFRTFNVKPDSFKMDGDRIVIFDGSGIQRFYMKDARTFEWEIMIPSRPESDSISFAFNSENLDFSYQSITYSQREIELNAYRPDSLKGSYAVYHSSRAWGRYKTGKAYNILPPIFIDANDNSITGKVLMKGEQIYWIADGDWWDNAAYPVLLGPTFGYTSQPGSSVGVNNTWSYLNRYPTDVLGSDGTEMIKTLLFFYDPPSAGSQSYMALYDWTRSDSCADSKVATSSISATDTDWAGALWWPHSVEYSPSANDSLTLAIGDFEAGTFFLFYDTQADGGDEVTGDLPATWGACGTDDWRFGMYATYDAEGPLFATDNYLGTNWTTPDSARINDDLCAAYNNTTQDYLCLHAFGFNIPTGATIDSFTVTVQSRGSAASGPTRRYRVGMTKDSTNVYGTAVLQTAVNAGACSDASNQIQSGDLLGGASWSAAEVNARGFGVILYDDNTTANELNFDAAWITVYFTPAVDGVISSPRRRKILTGALR